MIYAEFLFVRPFVLHMLFDIIISSISELQ